MNLNARVPGNLKRWLAMLAAGLLAAMARAQSCTPVPSGIVGWWRAEGNATDFIGTNNGVLLGGVSFTNGEVGQGFWFNNTNEGVDIPSSPSLSLVGYINPWQPEEQWAFTFECWIDPTDVSQPHAIFNWNELELSIESGGSLAARLAGMVPTEYGWDILATNVFYTDPGLVVTNGFQHVALVYVQQKNFMSPGTSATVYLYLNGVQVGVMGQTSPTISGDIYLGDSPARGIDFAGVLDEASLYSTNLTSNQIAAIYGAGPGGKCSAPPSIVSQPTNEVVPPAGEAIFSVTADPEEAYSYQWQLDGTNLTSISTPIITTVAATGAFRSWGSPASCVAVDESGNLFFSGWYTYAVMELAANGVLTTVAGTGTSGYSGDGGPATNAGMGSVQGIAVDGSGNLFIADSSYGTIRKVDANGIITTIAGNGTNGYSGDGGAATNAELAGPYGLAVDAAGDLFVADTGNSVIRKVDTHGIITTFAGNGTSGFRGDGRPAINAELNGPTGVAVDSVGDVFVCDDGNARIREVDMNGIINTFAGGGTNSGNDGLGDGGPATGAQFAKPAAVAVDSFGNLFIADSNGDRIREVFAGSGIILTVAGNGVDGITAYNGCTCDGGPATAGELTHPTGVAADNAGNLYIADGLDAHIRKVSGLPPYPPNFSAYIVNNASSADAGKYSVVITTLNTGVSVTSSVVKLTVAGSPVTTTLPRINIMPMGDSVTARGGTPESSYRYWLYRYLTNAGFYNTMFVGSQTGTDGASDGPPAHSWPQISYVGGGTTVGLAPVADGWSTWEGINAAPNAASILNSGNPGATILLLDLGANDHIPGSGPMGPDLSQMQRNLETIIQTFYHLNSQTVVLLAVPTPWVTDSSDRITKQFMFDLGTAITAVAGNQRKAGVKIVVVNLAAGFDPNRDTKDGTHPNIKGEQIIARTYFNALRPILRKMERQGL